MPSKLLRYLLSALAVFVTLLMPLVSTAHAGKEKFVRSKPHVNVGTISSSKSAAQKHAHPDFLWLPTGGGTVPQASGLATKKPAPKKGLGGRLNGSVEIDVDKIKQNSAKTTTAKDASFITLKFSPEPTKGAPQKPKRTLDRR